MTTDFFPAAATFPIQCLTHSMEVRKIMKMEENRCCSRFASFFFFVIQDRQCRNDKMSLRNDEAAEAKKKREEKRKIIPYFDWCPPVNCVNFIYIWYCFERYFSLFVDVKIEGKKRDGEWSNGINRKQDAVSREITSSRSLRPWARQWGMIGREKQNPSANGFLKFLFFR